METQEFLEAGLAAEMFFQTAGKFVAKNCGRLPPKAFWVLPNGLLLKQGLRALPGECSLQ
jgi:hypothetical protein